jgi:hypothetical protein
VAELTTGGEEMKELHELAEKVFIAYLANGSITTQNSSDSHLATYAYDLAEAFLLEKKRRGEMLVPATPHESVYACNEAPEKHEPKLEWKEIEGAYTWHQAMALENDGWRLATKNELLELWKSGLMPSKKCYWSSSPYAANSSIAWFVNFYLGLELNAAKGNGFYVRLVRELPIPHIIAPPEPVRLPDYKPGEWIAVWDDGDRSPVLSEFCGFSSARIHTQFGASWSNHCSLSELPEVLAKWGERGVDKQEIYLHNP